MLPGIDMANHADTTDATARWVLDSSLPKGGDVAAHGVVLRSRGLGTIKQGEEVTLNYGDGKSPEELLAVYGFLAAGEPMTVAQGQGERMPVMLSIGDDDFLLPGLDALLQDDQLSQDGWELLLEIGRDIGGGEEEEEEQQQQQQQQQHRAHTR